MATRYGFLTLDPEFWLKKMREEEGQPISKSHTKPMAVCANCGQFPATKVCEYHFDDKGQHCQYCAITHIDCCGGGWM